MILAAAGRRRLGSGANRSTKWSFDGSRTLSVPAWMTRSMVLGLIEGLTDALPLTDGSTALRRGSRKGRAVEIFSRENLKDISAHISISQFRRGLSARNTLCASHVKEVC